MRKHKASLLIFAIMIGFPLIFIALPLGVYIISICWRVSVAEQSQFGRSDLIPLTLHPRNYNQLVCVEAFGDGGFEFSRHGTPVIVYKQLVNGFQHAYGSALASYDLGSYGADLLFRANEYAESIFARNSGTRQFYEDTKKDLANNALGREIGQHARVAGLRGEVSEQFMIDTVLAMMGRNEILSHWQDPRVRLLRSPEQLGCPYLTAIQKARRGEGTSVLAD